MWNSNRATGIIQLGSIQSPTHYADGDYDNNISYFSGTWIDIDYNCSAGEYILSEGAAALEIANGGGCFVTLTEVFYDGSYVHGLGFTVYQTGIPVSFQFTVGMTYGSSSYADNGGNNLLSPECDNASIYWIDQGESWIYGLSAGWKNIPECWGGSYGGVPYSGVKEEEWNVILDEGNFEIEFLQFSWSEDTITAPIISYLKAVVEGTTTIVTGQDDNVSPLMTTSNLPLTLIGLYIYENDEYTTISALTFSYKSP
jgi:hypothetical protein